MEHRKQYYRTRGLKLVKEMRKRNMAADYFDTAGQAVEAVLKLIPTGSSVSWGGSVTMDQTGLKQALRASDYRLLDRDTAEAEDIPAIYHAALSCDYYIMSSNAVTMDGKLVNIDGRGNRLAALIYGPENVVVIAGMNKVVEDEAEALSRVRNEASPINAVRLDRKTPCASTGSCSDCLSDDCICSHTVITRRSIVRERIKVFLVGEDLGF